ncbi:GOLPH3/VPS74 family protein [Phytohabitans sp. LJ34]|uniref:GOLPH3/VPS74 family protein n=1 Tax=Phytohabitans sp. LJ34 TaxID=3452217 RepID=UPI003F8B9DC5
MRIGRRTPVRTDRGCCVDGVSDHEIVPDLTLPEAAFVLAHPSSGWRHPRWSTVEVLVGAAALAELYLGERIELDPDGVTLKVRSSAPSGDPVLDEVVARITGSNARSPVEWLGELAPSVTAAVLARLRERGLCEADGPLDVRWTGLDVEKDLRRPTREALTSALRDGDVHASVVVLGTLLAGVGLAGVVASFGTKRQLRRLAKDDWLAVSMRSYEGYLINVALGTTNRVYAPAESVGKRLRGKRMAVCFVLLLIGAGIATVALVEQSRQEANAKALRDQGTPMMADVVSRSDHPQGRYESLVESKLTLVYRYADKPYRTQIACIGTCPAQGDQTRIMVDTSQPRVFLTEWGEFTDVSPRSDMAILAGGALIVVGLIGAVGVLMPETSGPRLLRPRRGS